MRPREKLLSTGVSSLSDQELLCVILSSGIKGKGIESLAKDVLAVFDLKSSIEDLLKIKGLGRVKAMQLLATLEFSRRRIRPNGVQIRRAADVVPLIWHTLSRKQEVFLAISLNGAHEVIAVRTITIGLVNFCQVHPREVFADVLTDRACAIVVAHNHPSGSLVPSPEDRQVTERLTKAGDLLGIKLLDHIIVSYRGYFSFEEGYETLNEQANMQIIHSR